MASKKPSDLCEFEVAFLLLRSCLGVLYASALSLQLCRCLQRAWCAEFEAAVIREGAYARASRHWGRGGQCSSTFVYTGGDAEAVSQELASIVRKPEANMRQYSSLLSSCRASSCARAPWASPIMRDHLRVRGGTHTSSP